MATSTKKSAPWASKTETVAEDAPASPEIDATPGDPVVADTTPQDAPENALEARLDDAEREAQGEPPEDTVIVEIPKAFQLMVDHHAKVDFKPGVHRMKREYAEHWWAVANGVKVFEG